MAQVSGKCRGASAYPLGMMLNQSSMLRFFTPRKSAGSVGGGWGHSRSFSEVALQHGPAGRSPDQRGGVVGGGGGSLGPQCSQIVYASRIPPRPIGWPWLQTCGRGGVSRNGAKSTPNWAKIEAQRVRNGSKSISNWPQIEAETVLVVSGDFGALVLVVSRDLGAA